MAKALCVIVSVALLAAFSAAQDSKYCQLKSCGSNVHTACKYGLKPSASCGKVQSSGVTQAEKNELLATHNSLRAKVASGKELRGNPGPQPAATNLGNLQWSDELAKIAQTWADQCNFSHDKCRNTADFTVGQNIAYQGTTGQDKTTLSQLVNNWYNEVALFSNKDVKSYKFDSSTGHYSQLVWAKTKYLGCGVIRYNPDGKWNKTYLVCNYGPAGNYIGQEVYQTA